MVSMRVKEKDGADTVGSGSPYGWGLSISLNAGQLASLGLKQPLQAGLPVRINAIAYVSSVSAEAGDADGDENGKQLEMSMSLQITDLELTAQRDSSGDAAKLYGEG